MDKSAPRRPWLSLGWVTLAFCFPSAHAVILYHTGDPTDNTTAPAGELKNSGWQYHNSFLSFTGYPISPDSFVVSKHIVGGYHQGATGGASFTYLGVTYDTVARYDEPNGGDLTVLKINPSAPQGPFPSFVPLYRKNDEVGKNFVVLGRGFERGAAVDLPSTPITDVSPNGTFRGWQWGGNPGTQRWGENKVDLIATLTSETGYDEFLYSSFTPPSAGGLANEATLTAGDSSGGVFIKDLDDGIWKLAAVNTAVDATFSLTSEGSLINLALVDGGGLYDGVHVLEDTVSLNRSFGPDYKLYDLSSDQRIDLDAFTHLVGNFHTRISNLTPWLDSVRQFQALAILTQPRHQTARLGESVAFSVTANGAPTLSYQWRKNGVDLAGATAATLNRRIAGAADSGGYSVVVRNATEVVVSTTAHLAVLTDGADQRQPTQITASASFIKETGKNNLIVIIHGWLSKEDNLPPNEASPPMPSWVTSLANDIRTRSPNDWQVVAFDWALDAWAFSPDMAFDHGKIKGILLGRQLAQQAWMHVHMIAHGAGSALTQAAADVLNSTAPATEIHTTFLDPFLRFDLEAREWLGSGADWSDNYFSEGLEWGADSGGRLFQAHNVEVTGLDTAHLAYVTSYCFPSGMTGTTPANIFNQQAVCGVQPYVASTHGWPYAFYQATVVGIVPNAQNYGFPRSKAGGGWGDRNNYPLTNVPLALNGQTALPRKVPPLQTQAPIDFSVLQNATSPVGASFSGSGGFKLNSGTPAWLAVGVPVTGSVNFVQFEAGFSSISTAEGLLTVYWNTNQIGVVEGRAASPGMQSYRFALPGTETNGLFSLSFRLEAFNQSVSSVTLTNVATGFTGVAQPLSLEATGLANNGALVLKLTGAPDYTYLVQVSTKLGNWTPTALLVNPSGTVLFAEPGPVTSSARFYRAILP